MGHDFDGSESHRDTGNAKEAQCMTGIVSDELVVSAQKQAYLRIPSQNQLKIPLDRIWLKSLLRRPSCLLDYDKFNIEGILCKNEDLREKKPET